MKCFWFVGRGAVEVHVCMFGYVIPTVRCWLSPLSGVLYLSGWAELLRLSTFRELKPRVQANTDQVSLFSILIRWPSALPNTRTICQWNRWSRTRFRTRGVPFSCTELFFCFLLQARNFFPYCHDLLLFRCRLCHFPLSAHNFPLFIYFLLLGLFIARFRTAYSVYGRSDQWFWLAPLIIHMGNIQGYS